MFSFISNIGLRIEETKASLDHFKFPIQLEDICIKYLFEKVIDFLALLQRVFKSLKEMCIKGISHLKAIIQVSVFGSNQNTSYKNSPIISHHYHINIYLCSQPLKV